MMADGKIYVTDYGNHRLVRMDDIRGTNWISLGTKGEGRSQFNFPVGLVAWAGMIFVADEYNNRIVRIQDMNGANWATFPQE